MADHKHLPGDSEIRSQAAINCAGALCNPENVIEDWGDFDGDYTQDEHDKADGKDDPYVYYDSCNKADNIIRILKPES